MLFVTMSWKRIKWTPMTFRRLITLLQVREAHEELLVSMVFLEGLVRMERVALRYGLTNECTLFVKQLWQQINIKICTTIDINNSQIVA